MKGRGALFLLNFSYLLPIFLAANCAFLFDKTSFMLVSLLKSFVSASAISVILKERGAFSRDIFLYFCENFLAGISTFLFVLFEVVTFVSF